MNAGSEKKLGPDTKGKGEKGEEKRDKLRGEGYSYVHVEWGEKASPK